LAAGASAQPAPAAAGPQLADASVRNLLAVQRQLLALYAHKLSPSLAEKLALRSTLQMLAGLPPGDIRLGMFWTDYDVSVQLLQCCTVIVPSTETPATVTGVGLCTQLACTSNTCHTVQV
jgi:hypothetical protein